MRDGHPLGICYVEESRKQVSDRYIPKNNDMMARTQDGFDQRQQMESVQWKPMQQARWKVSELIHSSIRSIKGRLVPFLPSKVQKRPIFQHSYRRSWIPP